ncbi:hypothetical protein H0H92_002327, partial [Tricholoma furcatifolium]
MALEMKLRTAEDGMENLKKEVTDLRERVKELENARVDSQEKDGKLRAALAEIEELRGQLKSVGRYLIDFAMKKEPDSEA